MANNNKDSDPQETREWIESIEDSLEENGFERTRFLLEELIDYAQVKGARLPVNTNTPFMWYKSHFIFITDSKNINKIANKKI